MMKYLILIVLFITVCKANNLISQTIEKEARENINYESKRAKGIDLIASGNEPFWNVDMDSEDSTTIYILSNSYTFKYKTPALTLDTVSNTIKYMFDTGVTLILKKEKCVDNMSGANNEFVALLNILNTTYKGCGKYIIASNNPFLNPYILRLNDIWALTKFRDKIIDPKSFTEGVPLLELHLNDGFFLGNTNCNTISGNIDVGESYIYFSEFTTTKKLCDGDFEFQYIQDLKSVDSWEFDKMKLILKSKGKEILVYNKID
jgi:uncharacterized membrane protein